MELMRSGLYNAWVDRSLGKLAELMPARYAKGEISSGFMGSIHRYAYSTPASQLPPAPATGSGAAAPPDPSAPAEPPAESPPTAPVTTSSVDDPNRVREVSVASAG
jgi:hypothetical protein